jgi:hypothetical protein
MGMFWNRQKRTAQAPEVELPLHARMAALEADHRALSRDVLDLDARIARWLRREQRDAREERGVAHDAPERSAGAFGSPGMAAAKDGALAPHGLHGAARRIWERDHAAILGRAVLTPNGDGG